MAVYEVAIAVADRGTGRVQEGDIVVARKPLGYVGMKEQSELLWVLIETDISLEALNSPGDKTKRRYSIPLANLDDQGLDLARVRDVQDKYQPCVNPRIPDGVFDRAKTAITDTGRIVDKAT